MAQHVDLKSTRILGHNYWKTYHPNVIGENENNIPNRFRIVSSLARELDGAVLHKL